jgi:hypothetical protein
MTNYFKNPDALVDAVRNVLTGQPTVKEEKVVEAVKTMDGDVIKKGDIVGFKDGYEKSGRVEKIVGNQVTIKVSDSNTGQSNSLVKMGSQLWKEAKEEDVVETNKNDDSDDGEGLDAVQPKAVKKKFKNRKDKDIDNDGDTDSSDEYLHKRRKAVSKAVKEDENPANSQHLCAKNVVHESWGEGLCVATMHADPDEEGNIEWYDVMFDHGIEEQVSIEELKVTKAEDHIHASKKTKIKESKDDDDDEDEDEDDDKPKAKAKNGEDKDSSKEDEENGKKNKVSGKKDTIDTEPDMKDQRMTSEMSDSQEKKREEIVLSMKKKMPEFKKKYGDRAKDVMYATATKMAMKEGFELGIEKSNLIEEVELDEATVNVGDIKKRENINRGDKNKLGKVADMMAREREIERKRRSKTTKEEEVDEGTAQASLKSVMALDKKNAESKKQAKKYQKRDDANRKSNRAAGMEEVEVDESLNIDKGAKVAMKKDGKMLYGKVIGQEKVMGKPGVEVQWSSGQKGRFAMSSFAGLSMDKNADYVISEDLDEARGRPRKDGTKSDSDDREQIQMQLRKSISLRGLKDVMFDDGKKVKVSARDARDVLGKLDAIKAPKERQNAVVHIAKSHKNLVDFAKGKSGEMDPEQRRKDAANSPFKKK